MTAIRTTPTSSLQTEDDYSIISRAQGSSVQSSFLYDTTRGQQYSGTDELPSSPLSNGSIGEHEHLITSYHALQTAYDHMKRRFSETVEIKNSLQRRLKAFSAGNSMDRSTSVHQIAASHENEVAKAWEAYSDKCKECEKLRDDLRAAEQKTLKTQLDARDMSLREDMLRAQSQQDEYKKQLQQAELEIRDHKDKLEMAREDLAKEKEYLNMLRDKVEERHNEMERTIESLRQELQKEKQKNQEFIKDFEKQRQNAQEAKEKRESLHKDEIRKIEERLYQEQSDRSLAEHQIVELSAWKQEMERNLQASGVPLGLALIQQKRLEYNNDSTNSTCSDVDAAELMSELHSITEEIAELKKRTAVQSSMINEIYASQSMCNGFDGTDSFNVIHPPSTQISLISRSSDVSSVQPSMDLRQIVVDRTPLSSFDQSVKAASDVGSGLSSALAVSRQIHSVESCNSEVINSDRSSPHKIDIQIPTNLTDAFTNIRLQHKASGDLLQAPPHNDIAESPTSYYSACTETTGPLGDADHGTKTTHASHSSDSTIDTLVDGADHNTEDFVDVSMNNAEETRFVPPPAVANDRPSQRYGAYNYGNQPAAGYKMQPLWPSAGKNVAGPNLSPVWPPGSLANLSSFDVISDSSHDSSNSSLARSLGGPEYVQKGVARDLRGQTGNRPAPRDSSYPSASPSQLLKHPSAIPTNRARSGDFCVQTAPSNSSYSPSPRPPPRSQWHAAAVDPEEDDKAFMVAPDHRECPVCHEPFGSNVGESYMQMHINSHFSDDEMETSPMP